VALGEVRVLEQGIFSELDATEGGDFKRLLKNISSGQTRVRKELLQNDAKRLE
jgi:hypothetical protein